MLDCLLLNTIEVSISNHDAQSGRRQNTGRLGILSGPICAFFLTMFKITNQRISGS